MKKKVNKTYTPFDDPEIVSLFYALLQELLNESARGAILIGATHVDDALTAYIKAVLPVKTKKYQDKLLAYPGPLSSFSSKMELLYVFRYLNESTYNSLTALRKVRNNAAHSSGDFSIAEHSKQFEAIFQFLSPSVFVRNEALRMMVDFKFKGLHNVFDEHQLSLEERQKIVQSILDNKEDLKKLEEEELPHWQLVFGLTLLCGIIKHQQEDVVAELEQRGTWLQKFPGKNDSNDDPCVNMIQ